MWEEEDRKTIGNQNPPDLVITKLVICANVLPAFQKQNSPAALRFFFLLTDKNWLLILFVFLNIFRRIFYAVRFRRYNWRREREEDLNCAGACVE